MSNATQTIQATDEIATPGAAKPLIDTVQQLTALMSKEVELLKAMRLRDFGELQDRKTALADSYEQQSAEFRQIPGFAATLEPRLREELKDAVSRMHEVMKVNETAIKAARTVNERLARVILDAVHEQRNSAQGYSNGGIQQTTTAAPPVSVQIDQHL